MPSELPPALAQVVKRAVIRRRIPTSRLVRGCGPSRAGDGGSARDNPIQPLQGSATLRGSRFRRLLRTGAAGGAAAGAARRIRFPGPVHRPGGTERKRQVERCQCRAVACPPRRRTPRIRRLVRCRNIPGPYPFEELEAALLRMAVNPPPSLLDQLLDGEHRDTPGGEAGASRPTLAPAAGHRPVRGAVHPGAGSDGQRLPRCARRRHSRPAQPAPGAGDTARRLLRPPTPPPGSRRAAAARDRGDNTALPPRSREGRRPDPPRGSGRRSSRAWSPRSSPTSPSTPGHSRCSNTLSPNSTSGAVDR